MSLQPGEPPAGEGVKAALDAARDTDDPGELQVDLEDPGDGGDEVVDGAGLSPGVHESDKHG